MNLVRVELVKEIGNVIEYKITYQEKDVFTTKKAGKNSFNYDYEEIKNIPECVLDLVEKWILGEI